MLGNHKVHGIAGNVVEQRGLTVFVTVGTEFFTSYCGLREHLHGERGDGEGTCEGHGKLYQCDCVAVSNWTH